MKLFSALLFVNASKAASVKCMASDADDAEIKMTATVTNSEIKHDLTKDTSWTCIGGGATAVCTRSWNADKFGGPGETTFKDNNLVLKKSITASCKTTKVDGVTVCLSEGYNLEFKCSYPMTTTTVSNTYKVAGHDTDVSEEGVGKLNYKLTVVDADVDIGDTVNVKIEAVNKNLVWHALQDCTVSKDGASVPILNWYEDDSNLVSSCPNVLGVGIETKASKDTTKFSWTAFKWSTAKTNDVESQKIECTIALSENEPNVNTPGCDGNKVAKSTDNKPSGTTYANHYCVDYEDYEEYTSPNETTFDVCKKACEENTKCTSFTFIDRNQDHYMKRGYQEVQDNCELYEECKRFTEENWENSDFFNVMHFFKFD